MEIITPEVLQESLEHTGKCDLTTYDSNQICIK